MRTFDELQKEEKNYLDNFNIIGGERNTDIDYKFLNNIKSQQLKLVMGDLIEARELAIDLQDQLIESLNDHNNLMRELLKTKQIQTVI